MEKIKEKRRQLMNREGVLNQLFGIQNYVQLKCSSKSDYSEPQGLLTKCVQFVVDQNSHPNCHAFVLEGRSGSGKSLFLIEFLRELNSMYEKNAIQNLK